MATKFYLHDATTDVTGTLPGASRIGQISASIQTASADAATNRTANETIGLAQVSAALTTSNTVDNQTGWFRRFITGTLAAQTISSQTISISIGASESNANSDMFENGSVAVIAWRPSDGSIVGHLRPFSAIVLNEPGTSQTVCTGSSTSASVTVADGDVLVIEVASSQQQAMATAYTNTFFYDGTTEGSTTNIASYVNFANTLTFSGGGPTANPPYRNPMPPLIAQ